MSKPTLSPRPSEWKRVGAEFIGTLLLTFVAAGADVIEYTSGGAIGHVARYVAPALLVMAMIGSLSGVSGAHINPAVTLAFVIRRVFPLHKAFGYWIVQFAGAVAAALLLRLFFGSAVVNGVTHAGLGITPWAAFGWEALITTILIVVILSTAAEKAVVGRNAALAVGLTVAACGLFSSPITGASMNPARSFGPQLVSQSWEGAWIYFAGPVAGALIATLLASLLHDRTVAERQVAEGEHQSA